MTWVRHTYRLANAALFGLATSALHTMHHRYLSALVVALCMQAGDSPANGKDLDDKSGESGGFVLCNVSSGFSWETNETATCETVITQSGRRNACTARLKSSTRFKMGQICEQFRRTVQHRGWH